MITPSQVHISEKHLIQIGLISVHFNDMMDALKLMIRVIAKAPDTSFEIILSKLPEKELTRTAQECYLNRFGNDENFEDFKRLFRNVDALIQKRNTIVHSKMIPTLRDDQIVGIKAINPRSGEYGMRHTQYDTQNLKKTIDDFASTVGEVMHKMRQILRINSKEYRESNSENK